jgi:hypothetical protein
MKANEVKGPVSLANYLTEHLSQETKYAIYRDLKNNAPDKLNEPDDGETDPDELVSNYVFEVVYTAGYNMLHHTIDEAVGSMDGDTQDCQDNRHMFEQLMGE